MTGNESDPAKDPDRTVFDADSVFGGDAGDAGDAEGTSDSASDDIWGPFTGEAVPDHNTQVLESDAFGRARPFLSDSEDAGDPFAGDQSPWSPGDEPGGRDPWGPSAFGDQPAEPAAHMEHEVPPPWEFESGGAPGPWSPPPAGGADWQPGSPASPAADNGQQPWQPPDDGFDPFAAQQPPGSADGGGIPRFDAPQPGTEVPNPFATADFGAPTESTPSPFDDEPGEPPSFWPSAQHPDAAPAPSPDPDPDHPTDVLPKPAGQPSAPGQPGHPAGSDTGPFGQPQQPGGDTGPFGGQPDGGPSGQPAQPGGDTSPFGGGQPDGDASPFGQPWQPGDSGQPGGPGPFGQPGQPGGDTGQPGQPPQPGDSGQPGGDAGPFGRPAHPGGGPNPFDGGQPDGGDLLSPFDRAQSDTGQPNPFEQPPQRGAGQPPQPGGGPPNPFAQPSPWPADAGQQAPQQPPPPPQQQQAPRYDLSQFQQGYQGQQPPQPPPQQDHGQQFGYPQQQAPGTQQYPNMGPPLQMPPQQQAPLTSDNLSPQALLRPRKAPPTSGWRRAVFKVSGGMIDPGESNKEIQRQQMVSLVRTPVAGGHYRVAVLSLKGGVGKTTTTVGLGSTLASLRGDRIIAVDANPDRGTLSEKVRLETRANVRDLLANRGSIERYSDVRQYTSQAASRLEVLASDPDPAISEAFSENDYRAIADVLEHYYSICLTDCGTGLLHSAMRGVLGLADQIVLVSSASVDGARSASATLDWLDAHDYGDLVQSGVVVMSAVRPQNKAVDLSRLEQHFSARCRALVRIPFDPHLEAGAEFVLDQLSAPTHDAYLELTAAVAAGFQYRLPR